MPRFKHRESRKQANTHAAMQWRALTMPNVQVKKYSCCVCSSCRPAQPPPSSAVLASAASAAFRRSAAHASRCSLCHATREHSTLQNRTAWQPLHNWPFSRASLMPPRLGHSALAHRRKASARLRRTASCSTVGGGGRGCTAGASAVACVGCSACCRASAAGPWHVQAALHQPLLLSALGPLPRAPRTS